MSVEPLERQVERLPREDLTERLLNLQDAKGFWVNSNNRWWEKDPVLVTAYTNIALDYIARGM